MEQQSPTIETDQRKETLLSFLQAVLLLVIGYLYLTVVRRLLQDEGTAFLYGLCSIALFLITLVFGLLRGGKLDLHGVVALLLGLSASVYPWLNGGFSVFSYLNVRLLMISYAYFVLALFQNHNRKLSFLLLFPDTVKAHLIYPFRSLPSFFKSLVPVNKASRKVGKSILFTLIGIIVAVVLGLICIGLLSYEPSFAKMFDIEWDWEDVPSVIFRLFFCVPVATLLFSQFTSSKQHKLSKMSTPETEQRFETGVKKIPAVIFLIPTAVLVVIYACFFFTQIDTYTSAFSGVLPDAYKAAEYARNGFFELCAVSFINTLFGLLMNFFMKESNRGTVLGKKIANTLLAVATLILIATALSKMILYIRRFDLTVMRLIVSVILVLIAIGFVLSILAQWIKRVKVAPVLIVCVSALLLVAPFLNVRGRIAKYNVDAYLERQEQGTNVMEIDVDYLTDELGTAAIPDAVRLLKSGALSAASAVKLERHLRMEYRTLTQKDGVFEMTLADMRAREALENAGL